MAHIATAAFPQPTFFKECLRLLYWTYFKPYTLRRYLRTAYPDLKDDSNPFSMREQWKEHPRLRLYAEQVWWLTVLTPLFAALLVGPLYTFFSTDAFDWGQSGLFLLGWWVGNWIARGDSRFLRTWAMRVIWGISILVFGFAVLRFVPAFWSVVDMLPAAWLATVDSAISILLPIWPLAGGVAFGVAFGVAVGVAVGVAGGVAGGVAFGVAGGVAGGVAVVLGVLRVYFWLPELLWTFLVGMLSLRSTPDRWLMRLPFWFDELIVLPLPFVDEMIITAYRQNPSAARQTIDYLTTSTNLQGVAAHATAGIAVDLLERCDTLQDVEAVADQLAWIPSPPPAELGEILPQFVEISQGVRAATQATSPYRQLELMAAPLGTLAKVRQALSFGANRQLAPIYGAIAERWLALLQAAQRTLQAETERRREIPQVYIAGASLDPETAGMRFKGRQDLFRQIEELSLSPQPPVLLFYGGRRTGKTSALKYLPLRTGPDLIPLFVDIQGAAVSTTLVGLVEKLVDDMIAAARRSRNLRLPYAESGSFQRDPFVALLKWMDEAEKVARGKRFLLCLDEFERLGEIVEATNSRAPLNFLRHVMQNRPQWILLFSGSHLLEDLPIYWTDYLINTQALRVSYLSESEARDLITNPVAGFPAIYEPAVIEKIVQLTRGQPYLLQLMGYVLVNHLNEQTRTLATAEDVEAVIPDLFQRGSSHFLELWYTTLATEERAALAQLSNGDLRPDEMQPLLNRLIRKEVLELTPSGYEFQVPLIRRYAEAMMRNGQ